MMRRSPTPRPEAIRAQGVEILQQLVSAAVSLRATVHDAHVNVDGIARGSLHALFGALYDVLSAHVDQTKERIKALGGVAVEAPSKPPITMPSTDGLALCELVADELDVYLSKLDGAVGQVDDLRLTADKVLLEQAMADIEKPAADVIAYLAKS